MAVFACLLSPVAYADADSSEIQITNQPDKLIIQLGTQWAGVEFELKTDAGVFPVPIIVDASGILQMDLGGSKSYILSCLSSPTDILVPEHIIVSPTPAPSSEAHDTQEQDDEENTDMPVMQIVMFIAGLTLAVFGLLVIRYFKRRRDMDYYADDDDVSD